MGGCVFSNTDHQTVARQTQSAAKDNSLPRLTPRPACFTNDPSVDLTGTWRFHPAPPKKFWVGTEAQGEGWADIAVPGEWVMQGFTVEKDAAAAYWRTFDIPAAWQGQRIKLRCDGVFSDATVWVNGQEAGHHEGGFTPFELDVTPCVVFNAANRIALAVKNESVADTLASASQYATHPLGGITRKIGLFAVPDQHLATLNFTTTFDAACKDALLHVKAEIVNEGAAASPATELAITLNDPKPQPVTLPIGAVTLPAMAAGASHTLSLDIPVAAPLKWDAEHPNLYTVVCTLAQGGKTVETVQRRIGFRQVEVRGSELYVNNQPVKLHGVCRHETHPTRGRSLTPELWRQDADLFRKANVNYIRTSHYPPAEEFIEACDELGLFVEEEAPICWAGHGANAIWKTWKDDDEKFRSIIVRETLEMVARDYNHPSVIIWSLANESLWNAHFQHSLDAVKAADPSRPASFHDQAWGPYNNQHNQADIAVFHYPTPEQADKPDDRGRPMLFGEYCHLNAYNRREIVTDPGVRDAWGQAIASMYDKMYAAKGCLGGAIWSGIDDIFLLPDGKAVGYGSWGPIDGWRRKKPEYWHMKKAYSPIRILDTTLAASASGVPLTVKVENRYDFTNLKELRIEWHLGKESGFVHPDIPPRKHGGHYDSTANRPVRGRRAADAALLRPAWIFSGIL